MSEIRVATQQLYFFSFFTKFAWLLYKEKRTKTQQVGENNYILRCYVLVTILSQRP